ncbi:MAG TPA: class I adenylate-forming enzyme family protein [Streptosporangiaceae bacterium]|nr:class I adenylate-forming enzyme family protein [Streptosporangiaceae bacterium]
MLRRKLDLMPAPVRTALTGPGGPFELAIEPVRGAEMTVFARRAPHLPAHLLAAAARHPGRPYLVFPDRTVSYGEAVRAIPRVAAALRERFGVGRGDRVALAGANSAEYALALWAVAWLGGIAVGLNGWWTGAELEQGLELTEPGLVLGDERRLSRLRPGAAGPGVPVIQFGELVGPATADTAPAPVADIDEDDPVSILFTSGTTGQAKGAVITHRGLVNFAGEAMIRGALDALTAGDQDQAPAPDPPVSLQTGPFFHISGIGPLMASAPASGITLVFPPEGRWDPARHLELTARHRISVWAGVPTQLIRLLRHPDLDQHDLSSLRTIAFGGAQVTAGLTALLRSELPAVRVSNGYGMTETCGMGTSTSGADLLDDPLSVGLATPTSEVVLRDADGRDIPDDQPDTVGEICIRSPSVFLGYWRDQAATEAVLDAGGWYRTGDFGRIRDGVLGLESRMRDLIIRGGENIYPVEIENRLAQHPDVLDAAVIGVPHDELGQEVLAVVVARDGQPPSAGELRRWAGQTLAPFKVPSQVRFAASLPYSETGKLLKRQIERDVLDSA